MDVFQKRKKLIDENVIFEFSGELNHQNINLILQDVESIIVKHDYVRDKLVYKIIVELFQSDLKLSEDRLKPPKLIELKIAFVNKICHIYFSRFEKYEKAIHITRQINELENKTSKELKELFRETLQKGRLSQVDSFQIGILELRRRCWNMFSNLVEKNGVNSSTFELILEVLNIPLFRITTSFNLSRNEQQQIISWHEIKQNELIEELNYVVEELKFHKELRGEKIVSLLTSEEFLRTYKIRTRGLQTIPDEWLNQETFKPDYLKLDEIWIRPSRGYLYKILSKANDNDSIKRLQKLEKSDAFAYRGADTSLEERKKKRLQRLQKSIENKQVVLFLGRQNRVYKHLQDKLNEKYNDEFEFISDHVWSARGYIEPGVKSSDSRQSILQAVETIRRMPSLGLKGQSIEKRAIAFSLDGYDEKVAFAAMYSNPNRIERNYPRPKIEGLDEFELSYTGLTDLELANIVRNKDWFDFMIFYRTGKDGDPEILTREQVAEEYGIKYIGDLMIDVLKKVEENTMM
jgi:hypothetical protein